MQDKTVPDQETATFDLLMQREVDKRVMLAFSRALNPSNTWEAREIARAYDTNNDMDIQRIVRNMFITAVMSDGSLVSHVKSKLAEQLTKPY